MKIFFKIFFHLIFGAFTPNPTHLLFLPYLPSNHVESTPEVNKNKLKIEKKEVEVKTKQTSHLVDPFSQQPAPFSSTAFCVCTILLLCLSLISILYLFVIVPLEVVVCCTVYILLPKQFKHLYLQMFFAISHEASSWPLASATSILIETQISCCCSELLGFCSYGPAGPSCAPTPPRLGRCWCEPTQSLESGPGW